MTALGFIETKGLLAAIEAADVMLKTAEVRLLERNLASGGLVTISVAGEVAAVHSSVDAAAAAIQRIRGAILVSRHVIARPDTELASIIALRPRVMEPQAESARSALPDAAFPVPEARVPQTAPQPGDAKGQEGEERPSSPPQEATEKEDASAPGKKTAASHPRKKKK
jgi:microcompartment protein CcmL/EutN